MTGATLKLAVRWIVAISSVLIATGVATEWLSFGWFYLFLLLALLAPLLWPRQFGSWLGLLVIFSLGIGAGLVLQNSPGLTGEMPNNQVVALALFLLLGSCALAPFSVISLLWRKNASVPLLLIMMAVMPMVIGLFAASGAFVLSQASSPSSDLIGYLFWIPLIWYPLMGLAIGSLAFLASFGRLLWQEAAGT